MENLKTEYSQFTVNYLSKFIKHNFHLIHLDLTNTGLSEVQMW